MILKIRYIRWFGLGFGYFWGQIRIQREKLPSFICSNHNFIKIWFFAPLGPPWGPIGGSQGPGAVEFCRPRRCRRVIIRAHPYVYKRSCLIKSDALPGLDWFGVQIRNHHEKWCRSVASNHDLVKIWKNWSLKIIFSYLLTFERYFKVQ